MAILYIEKPENGIDGDTWLDYFSNLSTVPVNMQNRLRDIENKVKVLENNISRFCHLDFEITMAELSNFLKLYRN